MKYLYAAAILLTTSCMNECDPDLPLAPGSYAFVHRDAEFPSQPGFPVTVTIAGYHYKVAAQSPDKPGTVCEIDDSILMWNEKVRMWTLGHDESDRAATHAGGCQDDGPDTIDFEKRIIWTCVGEIMVSEACGS